ASVTRQNRYVRARGAAEGLPRIGRTSIATHWRSCGLPQSASCSENFVIPPDVFGQTLTTEPPSLFRQYKRISTQHYGDGRKDNSRCKLRDLFYFWCGQSN